MVRGPVAGQPQKPFALSLSKGIHFPFMVRQAHHERSKELSFEEFLGYPVRRHPLMVKSRALALGPPHFNRELILKPPYLL